MEQMCSYCETFFVVPADEAGPADICPNCYQEYAPWMDGTEQQAKEAWRAFERRKLEEGIEPSHLQSLSETWRAQYKARFGKEPQL
jgi:hypothetical protein